MGILSIEKNLGGGDGGLAGKYNLSQTTFVSQNSETFCLICFVPMRTLAWYCESILITFHN